MALPPPVEGWDACLGLAGVCLSPGSPRASQPRTWWPSALGTQLLALPKGLCFFGLLAGGLDISVSCSVKLAVRVGRLRVSSGQESGGPGLLPGSPPEVRHHVVCRPP